MSIPTHTTAVVAHAAGESILKAPMRLGHEVSRSGKVLLRFRHGGAS